MSAYLGAMRPLLAALLLIAAPEAAAAATKDVTLMHPQVRASLGRAPNTAAYVVVRNAGARPDRLVSASCACAARVELHTHQSQGGVARMTRVAALAVPARGEAVLAPGGAHLMLIGLKRPLREGERQTLTLVFERAGAVTAAFPVRSVIETPAQAGHHAH